jgi:hypothetical protein
MMHAQVHGNTLSISPHCKSNRLLAQVTRMKSESISPEWGMQIIQISDKKHVISKIARAR